MLDTLTKAGALVVAAAGLFFGIGTTLGRGENSAKIAAAEERVNAVKEDVGNLRSDVREAAASARAAADETRRARERIDDMMAQKHVLRRSARVRPQVYDGGQ